MIVNVAGTQAISGLGWVDKGRLWVYKIGEGKSRHIPLSDAKYLVSAEPLNVALISDDHVIARDWRFGKLREGKLKKH